MTHFILRSLSSSSITASFPLLLYLRLGLRFFSTLCRHGLRLLNAAAPYALASVKEAMSRSRPRLNSLSSSSATISYFEHIYLYIYACVYLYMQKYIHSYIFIYIHVYKRTYTHMYTYINMCTYTHIYTKRSRNSTVLIRIPQGPAVATAAH